MPSKKQIELIPLFPTPLVKINIDRDFTEDELQFLFYDIPMRKDEEREEGIYNHQSKDYYLFDNFTDTLGDIKTFCEYHLKFYLEEIEGTNTDLVKLRITQSWLNKTKPQESHGQHFHTNSYLSGVLYISCLPNDPKDRERISLSFNTFPVGELGTYNDATHLKL
jgi:hypothetical protein